MELAHIMKAAHQCSPYRPSGLKNLNSVIFNDLDGSTGGDCSDLNDKEIENNFNRKHNLYNKRLKEFTPVRKHAEVKSIQSRYNSVQRSYHDQSIHQGLRKDTRREQTLNESSRLGNYNNSRRLFGKSEKQERHLDPYPKNYDRINKNVSTLQAVSKSTGTIMEIIAFRS